MFLKWDTCFILHGAAGHMVRHSYQTTTLCTFNQDHKMDSYCRCLIQEHETWISMQNKGYFTNSMAFVLKYPKPTDSLKEDMLWWILFSVDIQRRCLETHDLCVHTTTIHLFFTIQHSFNMKLRTLFEIKMK